MPHFIDEDDMNWLKGEIGGIKECIGEIAVHLKDVDNKLDKLLHDNQ